MKPQSRRRHPNVTVSYWPNAAIATLGGGLPERLRLAERAKVSIELIGDAAYCAQHMVGLFNGASPCKQEHVEL
jgi:hypothetical protein